MFLRHVRWFIDRIQKDRLDSIAAHGAFFIMISFIPFLSFLFMIFHRINISGEGFIVEALHVFPESVTEYINEILEQNMPTTGAMSASIFTFIWSASSGMLAIMKGFNQVYEVKETRNFIVTRLIAVAYLLLFAFTVTLSVVTVVVSDRVYERLSRYVPPFLSNWIWRLRSGFGFILLVLLFCLMFNLIPHKRAKFRNNLMGSIFSAAGWVLFSYFFSIFVENFANYSVIYGSLATLIALMFWLFSCMYIMFIGAEIAMWLEYSEIKDDLANLIKKLKSYKKKKKRNFAKADQKPEVKGDARKNTKAKLSVQSSAQSTAKRIDMGGRQR